MKNKLILSAMTVAAAFAANADSAKFLSANAGNTVAAAADYLLPSNWKDGTVGNAAGRDVTFDVRSSYGFVKLTDDVTVAGFSGFGKLVLIGDKVLNVSQGAATYTRLQNTHFYADVSIPSGVIAETYDSISVCGDVSAAGYVRFLANTHFRADRYAKTADAVRVTPWAVGDLTMSGNYVWYYAPRGSAAVTSTWRQTDASPYLFPVSADANLSVGTAVTGDGIKAGTFLKRIFPDGSIELSQPVEKTVAENSVTFASFNPTFEQVHKIWRCVGDNGRVALVKYRASDSARLVFSGYSGTSPRGITMPDWTESLCPGTVVLSNACNYAQAGLWLGRCRVELPGTSEAGGAGLPNVPYVSQYDAASESVLIVPADVSAVVNNFTNLVGTLAKEGAGTLTLDLENELTRNSGTLSVREGTLIVSSATDDSYVKNVMIAAGTILKLPAGTFRCDSLSYGAGAVVDGPGTLVLGGLPRTLDGLSFTNGAKVEFAAVKRDNFVYALPAAEVAGDPALWLDVSSGITTDAEGTHVLRWDDVRGAGHLFVTNRNEKLKPELVKNTKGENVSVFLPEDETSASADDQAILLWSRPLSNIRAIFIVKGACKGGGPLLGGITDMTWMRAASTTFSTALFYQGTKTTYPALANGRFYVNGESRSVDNGYAYPGGVTNGTAYADWKPQLAEFITAGDTYADNFAYNRGGAGRSGRQLIHAAIIYTNELTEVQRLATERYLLKRYGLVDVQVIDPASLPGSVGSLTLTADGAKLPVNEGGSLAVDAVSGAGTLEKSGAGLALVKDLVAPNADVVVAGGELVIRSYANDGTNLPGTPALHVDAALASSITTNSAGKVTKWADVRGESVNAATRIPGGWGYPTLVENAVGGRTALSFGTQAVYPTLESPSPALRFDNLECRAFFNVMSANNGGGVLLGCCENKLHNEGGKYYGIARQSYASAHSYAYNAEFRRPTWQTRDYDYALICNGGGGTFFRQNGVEKDISTAMPSSDYQLIACTTPEPINTSGFAQIKATATGNGFTFGGMNLGESILYTNALSRGAALQIEAFLNRKWFDVETTGYRPAQAKSLTVAAGASVTLDGTAPLTVETFASCGSVTGAVVVADGGSLEVTVAADGSVAPLGVTGTLTLAGDGTLFLTGAAHKVRPGSWLLADGVSVAGTWEVRNEGGAAMRRPAKLRVADGKLYLDVLPNGLMLIVR